MAGSVNGRNDITIMLPALVEFFDTEGKFCEVTRLFGTSNFVSNSYLLFNGSEKALSGVTSFNWQYCVVSTFYPKKMLVSVPKKSNWASKMLAKKIINGKLYCCQLIMSVTMTTSISSHVKDKNNIFTTHDEDIIFLVTGKILVFHQYLYNKFFFIFF